jgi:hypothetical protein
MKKMEIEFTKNEKMNNTAFFSVFTLINIGLEMVRVFFSIINQMRVVVVLKACHDHAMSSQAPPAALILFSAVLEKSLALTIIGIYGSLIPFPRTLK